MSRVPVITGLGLITPLGGSAAETWRALMDRRYVTNHSRCPFDAESPARVHPLAIAAAREALADARWTQDVQGTPPVPASDVPARERAGSGAESCDGSTASTALVVGTSKGAVDAWLTAPPEDSFLGSVASAIRARFALLDGPALTLSAACASGLHALIRAALMIRGGEADRVLVVAAEASVHPLFLGSFQRLGVLPREGVGCRPFDEDRDGFLMSEAAAAICLEIARDDVQPENTYARIDRFALLGNATHMTGSDSSAEALRRAIRTAVDGRPVDLIHAHGTGTKFHDPIELSAFEDECTFDGADRPSVYSHKGALGHSLGASGLVSVALNCLMHRGSCIAPNVQTRRPLATPLLLGREPTNRCVGRSIAVGTGFGGSIGVVSLDQA